MFSFESIVIFSYILIFPLFTPISLKLLIVFNHLVELRQLSLLILSELLHDEGLCVNTVAHLFLKLFNRSLHPVLVVEGRVDFLLFEMQPDLGPDFSDLEVRVHLDDFHLLLFLGVEVVLIEADSVQDAENDQADVVLLDLFLDSVD